MRCGRLFAVVIGLAWAFGWAARAQDLPATLTVGAIDFYGIHGTDTAPILKALPVHSGQILQTSTMEQTIAQVGDAAFAATGMHPTKIEVVCCREKAVDFYIGLPGASYRRVEFNPPPTGKDALPPEALALYQKDLDLLLEAIQRGQAGEDQSTGYALSKYAPQRKVQLAMHSYAATHETQIERVLRNSATPLQRQASAMLLGYSDRNSKQIAALTNAASDADNEVRNNAIRSLWVMLSTGPIRNLNVQPMIRLLYSGEWSDRNKASLFLASATDAPNPAVLAQLRSAMGPLIDGAEWESEGHAEPFLLILCRMGGSDPALMKAPVSAETRAKIIAAAQNP